MHHESVSPSDPPDRLPRPPAGTLVGLLADPERLKVLSAVALGARSPDEVAKTTGLEETGVLKALERLGASGVVVQQEGGLGVDPSVFAAAARRDAETRRRAEPTPESLGASPEQAAVLKNFLSGGRLTQLPTSRPRRLVVLDFLAGRFEPGRRYSEQEVNQVLSPLHDDVATLRRYLVDEGLLDRDHGVYWRTGGTVPLGTGPTR